MDLGSVTTKAFAAAMCLVIALLNLRSDEPQPAAGAIMLAVFTLTLWRPRRWLLWIVLFAAIIPLSYILAPTFRLRVVGPPDNIFTTAIAVLPAGLACAIAYSVRFHAFPFVRTSSCRYDLG